MSGADRAPQEIDALQELTRRTFVAGVAGAAFAGAAAATSLSACSSTLRSPGGSNVLILKSDEHNPRVSSVEGHRFVETPTFARLAASGVVYENAYCPSPLCCPSRSSFITGRPVHELQTYNNSMVLGGPSYPSYGAMLDQAGVHTVHAGKVDAYRPPDELGFTEMFGYGFRRPGDLHISRIPLAVRPGSRADEVGVRNDPFRRDDRTVEDALRFLERAKNLPAPWTMEVNLKAPHIPHWVTQDLWQQYAGCGDLPEYGADAAPAHHPYAADLRRHFHTETFTTSRTRAHRRAYYGRVSYVDTQLGRLLDKLEQTGQTDNTVVVYTSDHGEMLGMFGMWFKSSMYEDSARVPLIVAGPGFGRGVRVSTPVSQWDLGAAMFTATRVTRPAGLAGEPLQHIPADDTNRAVFAEYHGHGTRGSAYLVRQGQWKLIYNARAPHQLFDLDNDPHELHNLAAKASGTLRTLVDRLHDEFCDPEREQLRAEAFIRHQISAADDASRPPRT